MTSEKSPQGEPTNPSPTPPPEHSARKKLWGVVRILNVRLRFIVLMVIVGLIAGKWEVITNHVDRWTQSFHKHAATQAAHEEVEYYCPMHPNIIRSEPGSCPICGMPLAQRPKTRVKPLAEGVLAEVQLTPLKMVMGRIGTTPVDYRLLSREIRTVGAVDYDETRRATISARTKGRIDRMLVNYVGQKVNKGDPLALVYSPEMVVAQQELLTASASSKFAGTTSQMSGTIIQAARNKLLLWGLADKQIDEILAKGVPQMDVAISSPITGIVTEKKALEGQYVEEGQVIYTVADLGSVWLQAKVFESDIQSIHKDDVVEVTSTAFPNEIFVGRIAFLAFEVDPQTRTLAARIEIANPEYKLKPGMYVNAIARQPLGEVAEVGQAASAPASMPATAQAIPSTAVAKAYLALAEAFASDKTDEAAANELMTQAMALAEHMPQAAKMAQSTHVLMGKDLEGQRQAFKAISQEMIRVLEADPPAGITLYVAHCPMIDADWLSDKQEIRNPYAGSQMLTCGSITRTLGAPAVKESKQYVEGYYCPLRPDELSATSEPCKLDNMPTKHVRREKVLAVPEMAVIDTGTRKVVYRQSAPGVFDMVEVKVGPRAGEFFPVISGLAEGDEVATAGAFLVDAENRLNPAARVQYFGASGSPQAAPAQGQPAMPNMPGM